MPVGRRRAPEIPFALARKVYDILSGFMRSKIVFAGLLLVAVIGIGVGVALLAARSNSTPPPAPVKVADDSNPAPAPDPFQISPPPRLARPAPENKQTLVAPANTSPLQPRNLTNAPTIASTNDWDEKIDDIIGSDDADTNTVAKLYALFPTLPPDGQEDAAQHLSNLVDDEDYKPLGEMLKNDKLPEGVLDELLADVLNRPNNLKLPLLLSVASDANHAKHDEAKDLLELYLGEDYGSDWSSWGQHMTNWLQQNPE